MTQMINELTIKLKVCPLYMSVCEYIQCRVRTKNNNKKTYVIK